MRQTLFLATFLLSSPFIAQPTLFAQDAKDQARQEAAGDGVQTTETVEDPSANDVAENPTADDSDEAKISKLIRENKLADAAGALEMAIAADPDDYNLHGLRESLGTKYLISRKYDQAVKHLQEVFVYRVEHMKDPRNQLRISNTISLLRLATMRIGQVRMADGALDRAIDTLDQDDLGVVTIQAAARLIPQKALQLAAKGDLDGANELLLDQIEKIDSLDASGTMKETLLAAKCEFLYAAASLPGAADEAKTELEDYITRIVQEHPDSSLILLEYARVQSMFIARGYREDPSGAKSRLVKALEVLEPAAHEHRDIQQYLARLKTYEPRIEAALKLAEMLGQSAPEFQVAAWVNQGKLTEESIQGKVVLLDFWSVWCGPCIATFPHLRQWHDEFHEQGFEIVGVTRFYNYTWDDAAGRPRKSKEAVEPKTELEMLAKFMEHHDLRHPTIVTPKDSTMQKEFGVTGIPHAVLIDRKGIVQMIKVGSGPANAAALHEKIQELIAQ